MNESYEPPYSLEQIRQKYDDRTYRRLVSDPVHKWRAENGIELIHKEPTKDEFDRIWKNWQLMPDELKAKSDKKSIELFGVDNRKNHERILKSYDMVNETKRLFRRGIEIILEDWIPEFDKKPVNQWGEKWTNLDSDHYIFHIVNDMVRDCCSDPDEEHLMDSLRLSSVHQVEDGHYIATIFGGCNGGGEKRKLIVYLAVVKKLAKKLFEEFGRVWLVDWTNDCPDDVYTVRLAFSDENRWEEVNLTHEIARYLDELENIEKSANDVDEKVDEKVDPKMAVDMLAEMIGGNATHPMVHGFSSHILKYDGDKYRFLIVRRPWKNLIVYKNDEQDEFFAFDSHLTKDEFEKQAEEFISKVKNGIDEAEGEIGGEKSDRIPETGVKIWIDDVRPAPEGFKWFKSVRDFVDYCYENGVDNVTLIDTDHDAGDFQKDGGDYIRCFDYLDMCGCDNLTIHIHSANTAGANNIRRIISKNKDKGWKEIRNS